MLEAERWNAFLSFNIHHCTRSGPGLLLYMLFAPLCYFSSDVELKFTQSGGVTLLICSDIYFLLVK